MEQGGSKEMKIKTIWTTRVSDFDDSVNNAMEDGYQLTRREVLPDPRDLEGSVLYAELVLPDQPDEPETDDPIEALRTVQRVCLAVSGDDCGTDRCHLRKFCDRLRDGGDPTDWDLSEEAFT
jgi:hypothetical protein